VLILLADRLAEGIDLNLARLLGQSCGERYTPRNA